MYYIILIIWRYYSSDFTREKERTQKGADKAFKSIDHLIAVRC